MRLAGDGTAVDSSSWDSGMIEKVRDQGQGREAMAMKTRVST